MNFQQIGRFYTIEDYQSPLEGRKLLVYNRLDYLNAVGGKHCEKRHNTETAELAEFTDLSVASLPNWQTNSWSGSGVGSIVRLPLSHVETGRSWNT